MAKEVPFFLPSSQQDQRNIQRQLMMAQMLMSQQKPQREQTRIVPQEDVTASLLPGLSQAAGMFMQNKAMQGEEALKAKEYAALLEAMKGGQQPVQTDPGVDAQATPPSSSAMNPYGLDPQLAAHAYQSDPAKYMGEVLSANKPTEFERALLQSGFTPEQMAQARQHKYLPAPESAQDNVGDYQPGNYTTASWSKFMKSGNPDDLERYITPRQEFSPSFQNVTRTRPDGSTEQGTFNTRTGEYNWSGQVVPAGQKARVEAAGRAEGDIAGTRAAKSPVAYATYQAGIKSLEEAMSGTSTGPVAGRIPAITANQQIAEGAEATMAPVLKQLFRDAGEGTFTDADQAMLMKMVPTRKDHPEARKAKIEMIDGIVRAKLGVADGKSRPEGKETSAVPVDVGQSLTINGVKVKRVK